MSIMDLLDNGRQQQSRIYGMVVGVVTNNQDPDAMGRVKVKLPSISGEDESNWARIVSFMAGKEMGAFFLPEVDDEVLVAFEHGDINRPYVLGSLWNGVEAPPQTNSDGKNNIRMLKSRSGHVISLSDEDGKEKIEVIDKSGKNSITVDTKENTITIKVDKDFVISAPNGKVKIEATDFELKTSAAAKIEASSDIELKGSASVKVEASSSMDLKASGNMTVKGATVNIN